MKTYSLELELSIEADNREELIDLLEGILDSIKAGITTGRVKYRTLSSTFVIEEAGDDGEDTVSPGNT